jgi:hypothetical protein
VLQAKLHAAPPGAPRPPRPHPSPGAMCHTHTTDGHQHAAAEGRTPGATHPQAPATRPNAQGCVLLPCQRPSQAAATRPKVSAGAGCVQGLQVLLGTIQRCGVRCSRCPPPPRQQQPAAATAKERPIQSCCWAPPLLGWQCSALLRRLLAAGESGHTSHTPPPKAQQPQNACQQEDPTLSSPSKQREGGVGGTHAVSSTHMWGGGPPGRTRHPWHTDTSHA